MTTYIQLLNKVQRNKIKKKKKERKIGQRYMQRYKENRTKPMAQHYAIGNGQVTVANIYMLAHVINADAAGSPKLT